MRNLFKAANEDQQSVRNLLKVSNKQSTTHAAMLSLML